MRGGGGAGDRRGDPVRPAGDQGRDGDGRLRRERDRAEGDPGDQAREQFAAGDDGRVQLRVHQPRALRVREERRRGQRHDAAVAGEIGVVARARRGGCGGALGHDGRAGVGDPAGAGRERVRADGDSGVRGEVRERVLRTFPRGGGIGAAVRGPAELPDGPGERARGDARDRTGPAGRRGHDHGEAGAVVPGPDLAGAPAIRRAGGGVPGERRVLDDCGGGAQRLDRSRPGDDGNADFDHAGGGGNHSDVLREAGGTAAGVKIGGRLAARGSRDPRRPGEVRPTRVTA